MKTETFEDYLQEIHAAQYAGLDDDMPDDFNDWLADLDVYEYIEYGDKFAELVAIESHSKGYGEAMDYATAKLKTLSNK